MRRTVVAALATLLSLGAAGCINIPDGAGGGAAFDPDALQPPTDTDEPAVEPDATTAAPTGLVITQVAPAEGRTGGGELVVIEGNDFAEGAEVYFGSVPSPDVTVHSPVVIHARSPAHKPGQVPLSVHLTDGRTAEAVSPFLFRDLMAVTSIQPASGAVSGGTPVTLRGDGFTQDTRVLLGGRLLIEQTVVDAQTILGVAPPATASGAVDILAFSPWTNAIAADAFRYVEPPRIASVEPVSGPIDGVSEVTLLGDGLVAGSEVTVGGAPAEVLLAGQEGLVVEVLGGPEGPADVRVQTADGIALLPGGFTFVGPGGTELDLLNVQPATGHTAGGDVVTLVAYGLADAGALTVRFGNQEATITEVDSGKHRIRVLTPSGSGTVAVTIEGSTGASTLPGAFTYASTPVVQAVLPKTGDPAGGDELRITGSGFEGDLQVMIGALPATLIEAGPNQLRVLTPPGSPGSADVRVITAAAEGVLPGGFTYVPDSGPELYAITPNYGAIAGNTLVYVYGAGFNSQTRVRFDGEIVSGAQVISSTEIRVRAPKAPGPGTVDVGIDHGAQKHVLVDAYNYFDPYSPYGGAWGPPIDGTVNITVLDLYTTQPIEQAFVMLWADPSTPHKGLTDHRGQITFSAPGIVGAQMVTAAKSQYTAYSVVEYDTENVTVHLIPYNPATPSPGGGGGGPTGQPGGTLTGKVSGLGKYVQVPPQTCAYMADKGLAGAEGTQSCLSCNVATDCGPSYQCATVAEEGTFCVLDCADTSDCPGGYVCGAGAEGASACIPDPGERAAWCQPSHYQLWGEPPTPGTPQFPTDDGKRAWVKADGTYQMEVRLGEMAIICVGGVVRDPTDKLGSFLPLIMGVKRHVEPISAQVKPGVDVALNIPLVKDVPLRLDGAPLEWTDPNLGFSMPTSSRLRVAMNFGAEGYWTILDRTELASDHMVLERQPQSLTGDLEGVTYEFRVDVAGGLQAESGTRASKVKVLDVDRTFRFVDGAWKVETSGIHRDVHAMWGTGGADLWAVGERGLLAHRKNGSWLTQFSPAAEDLNGVWGTASDRVTAVGDGGAIVVFNGVSWAREVSPTTSDLFAVWGTSPDNLFAVGQGVALRRGASAWQPLPGGPGTSLHAAWGPSPTELWAAGEDGRLWIFDGAWTSVDLVAGKGLGLRAISGAPGGPVWVAGDQGTVFRGHPDGTWEQMDVPTTEQLNAVYASAGGEVLFAGARGTLLRFDGQGFSVQAAPKYGGDLRAVWGFEDAQAGSLAAGTQVVSLGPMLSFPQIGEPVPVGPASTFTYHLDWSAKPGASPTFNFVEMLAAPTYAFPAWWTVTAADAMAVDFPNLIEIQAINPFPTAQLLMKVNRVLKPGVSVDNFDFWDTYDSGSWKSWASDGVYFTPGF